MFTGIIECLGRIESIVEEESNLIFTISSAISHELKVDQSAAHDGVCLTVTSVQGNTHQVAAIAETLSKTNLKSWKPGTVVNLERALQYGGRMDGHFVQGHVDACIPCVDIKDESGSWRFTFAYDRSQHTLLIPKGSVCINGVSLTIADLNDNHFSVAIIPYTFQHTSFNTLKVGDMVNIEFDVLGKYINRYLNASPSVTK
jgi:riboflavin synthase